MRSVCTYDGGQDSPMQTDQARLIRCLLYCKQGKFLNSFNVTGCVLADILLANGDELNLILPKFARLLYFFFSLGVLALREKIKYC